MTSFQCDLFMISTNAFCRWAVSTVMTRQNQIPTPDGSKITFGLIPMWDMCNHCNGTVSLTENSYLNS